MLRTLLILLGVAALGFLLLAAGVVHWQERIVWQPPRFAPPVTVTPWGDVRRVEYVAADGQRLVGYLVSSVHRRLPRRPERLRWPLDTTGRRELRAWEDSVNRELRGRPPEWDARWNGRVLVAFHGNAQTAPMLLDWARTLVDETGWTVFLAEYRGYAGVGGRPTYEGAHLDARAAYAWVRDSLGVPPERVGIFGFSLGTAVAAELASEVHPSVLVLQAPFTSVRDMARLADVWPLSRLWPHIVRVPFDTRARVAELDTPVWVIHGGRDAIVPTWMGRAVFDAARRQGRYVEVPPAGHNDLPAVGGRLYWWWLEEALAVPAAAPAAAPIAPLPAPPARRRAGRGGG